jgi:hypothetical protein
MIIATDNLSVGHPRIALNIYNGLLLNKALITPKELAEGGRIAMQNNAHLDSAQFYWAAYERSTTDAEKKHYALKTIEVLWAGNQLNQALDKAQQLPKPLLNDTDTQLYLAELALSANHISQAKTYVLNALGQSDPINVNALKRIPFENHRFKLLFNIQLYQSSIQTAYEIALIALTYRPHDLYWHQKLAETATWVGQYNQAIAQWLYVVEHDPHKEDILHAIWMAKLLGYDQVVVKMYKIYNEKHPLDSKALLQLADEENRVGHPEEAILLLQQLRDTPPGSRDQVGRSQLFKESSERLATIYQDTGQWDKAIQTWALINQEGEPNIKNLMAQASINYDRGQLKEAIKVLVQGIPTAKQDDHEFWETIGELAWMQNDRPIAILAYTQDLKNTAHLLRLIDLHRHTDPQQALNYSLQGWTRFRSSLFLFDTLYLAAQLNQWPTLNHLLSHLSPEEWLQISESQIFWEAEANQYASLGMESEQKAVLAQGIIQHPELQQLKADLLWLIMGTGAINTLKILMSTWLDSDRLNHPILWHVFAEGFALFNHNELALAIYQAHLFEPQTDDQIIIDYANLLEKTGHGNEAYILRQALWKKLLIELTKAGDTSDKRRQSLAQLAPYVVSGTEQMQLFNALMRPPEDPDHLNIMLNWLMQQNLYPLVQWLKTQQLFVPFSDRIELFLALIRNDGPTLQRLLEHVDRTWPRADRLNAAIRLENTTLAEQLGFEELSERPLATEIHTEFTQYALADANALSIAEENEQFIDLKGFRTKLNGAFRLNNTWKIHPYVSVWDVRSTNNLITNVPNNDLDTGVQLDQKIHRGLITYNLGYRQALTGFAPIGARLNYRLDSRWFLNLDLGLNQRIAQTAYLYIGGVQDQITANFIYNAAKYDTVQTSIQAYNYYSQDRHYLSNGFYLHGLYEHKFYLNYPDFTVGIFADTYQFNPNGSYGGDITRLFPALTPEQQSNPSTLASINQANYQQIIPPSYSEGGLIVSFGNTILDYSHTLRPYLWTRLFYNTYVGISYETKVGLNTMVLGRDSLLLYFERGTSQAVSNAVTQTVGVRYASYF